MQGFKAFEQHLLRCELVDEARLEEAKSEAARLEVPLVEGIVRLGHAKPEAVYAALADFCEMRFVQPSKLQIDEATVNKVPARFATHYNFVPVGERNGALIIAVSDPLDTHRLDDIRTVLRRRLEVAVTTPDEIRAMTKALYGVGADTMERILSEAEAEGTAVVLDHTAESADLGDVTIDASIIKFVNELLLEAVQSNTTDIHIEPFENSVRVRNRIDGILHNMPVPPSIRGFHNAIVSRIKIMANLNIAEKRLPQDGKILATLGEGKFDVRVSILPTPHGETINLRILNRSSVAMTLGELGFLPDDMERFERFITRPHGIILVTGPTGSGKTTTLYAALTKLNKLDRKIITIEDPIEYQMAGITQMQVLPRIGFDFATGLRSMLRHDPDIMLVGEIRDYETAEMAIRSSLTGHLVLSTLHTNDAAGAVTRLADMGVEPFLISSTLIASMAQRLLRQVCSNCGVPHQPDSAVIQAEFGVPEEELVLDDFRKGEGCDQCRQTGYRGRMAMSEILSFTDAVRELTVQRATATVIKRKAVEEGMRTLRGAGWLQICRGNTTVEEVLRVTADVEVLVPQVETVNASV